MVKNPLANAGDMRSTPGLGRSPGGGNGNPLQFSCLKNSMGRGGSRVTVHGVTKSQTQLSDCAEHSTCMISVPVDNDFHVSVI